MAEHLIFSLSKELSRLIGAYHQSNDDPTFCHACIGVVSGYMRHLLTSDEQRRELARQSFASGVRVKKGDDLLGSGSEFERHLVDFWNELLTAGGFEPLAGEFDTGTQSLTRRITRLFRREKARPAAKTRLEGNVKAAALEFCSGLYDEPTLATRLARIGIDHLKDIASANQTVGAEAVALARRHGIVFKTGDQTNAGGDGYVEALHTYLHELIDYLLDLRREGSQTTSYSRERP